MKLNKYKFPYREYADAYFPEACRTVGILCSLAGCVPFVIAILALRESLIGFFVFLFLALGFVAIALWSFFLYQNCMILMESDEIFVQRTIFGNIYKYRFDEIKEVRTSPGGTTIVLTNKRILLDKVAILSEQFQSRLDQVKKETWQSGLSELPTSSEKTNQLSKNFNRHHRLK